MEFPLNPVASSQRHAHVASLTSKLETFAARALDLSLEKLRKQSHKTWLALGGDSLTAISFVGSCFEELGIEVEIPDVLQSESVANLIDGIARSHQSEGPASNGPSNGNGHLSSNGLHSGLPENSLAGAALDGVQSVGPCSPMQENFLALQSMDSQAYQMQLTVRISSTNPAVLVTPGIIKKSWSAVVSRHAALRTTFIESASRPGRFDQVVWSTLGPQVSIVSLPEAEDMILTQYGSGSPHHLVLAPATATQTYLKLFISHAIVDGVSTDILLRDLCRALTETLPTEEPVACADFLQAQQPDTSHEAHSYWTRYMAPIEGTFLSSPNSRSNPTGPYTIHQEMVLPPDLVQGLAGEHNATLVNACQIAYALVLRSYTGTNNICFSYTASGRQKRIKGLHDAVGNFVNALPCHVDFNKTKSVAEALHGVQRDFLSSLPHQGASLTDKQEMNGSTLHQLSDSLLSFHPVPLETKSAKAGFDIDVVSWAAPSDVRDKATWLLRSRTDSLRAHSIIIL